MLFSKHKSLIINELNKKYRTVHHLDLVNDIDSEKSDLYSYLPSGELMFSMSSNDSFVSNEWVDCHTKQRQENVKDFLDATPTTIFQSNDSSLYISRPYITTMLDNDSILSIKLNKNILTKPDSSLEVLLYDNRSLDNLLSVNPENSVIQAAAIKNVAQLYGYIYIDQASSYIVFEEIYDGNKHSDLLMRQIISNSIDVVIDRKNNIMNLNGTIIPINLNNLTELKYVGIFYRSKHNATTPYLFPVNAIQVGDRFGYIYLKTQSIPKNTTTMNITIISKMTAQCEYFNITKNSWESVDNLNLTNSCPNSLQLRIQLCACNKISDIYICFD
jgi:hypothetical protein